MQAVWYRPDIALNAHNELGDAELEFNSIVDLEGLCDAEFDDDRTAQAFEVACLRNRATVYVYLDQHALRMFSIRILRWTLSRADAEADYDYNAAGDLP